MCGKLDKDAHKKQSEQCVGYKHGYPFARQWVDEVIKRWIMGCGGGGK